MEEISCKGHRKRIREAYLKTGTQAMADHNILELFLSLVIPQKDVKPLAYDLINTFGSLERVFSADINELLQVKGIGENTAIIISLHKDIYNRISINKNREKSHLNSPQKAIEYAQNAFASLTTEKILFITLDNNLKVIQDYLISSDGVNFADANPRKFIEAVVIDSASSAIVAHNHPNGEPTPSEADINFTLELRNLMRKFDVKLRDHIIVGENSSFSMLDSNSCSGYLDT
jgi:DNA repair protein RadC